MVRKIMAMAVLLSGCQVRTEYGKIRNTNALKGGEVDTKVFSIIDTAKIYEQVGAIDTAHNETLQNVKQEFVKFYSNGKVATFSNYDPNDVSSLNPRKADMGFYEYKDQNLKVRFFFKHPQGGGWVKGVYKKTVNDDFYMTSGSLLIRYKIRNLPRKFLIYKPDW
ncbi:hypothetical protein IM793_02460 [Pedobacter sp. MR2016-19]|uniref:hypothetical protein n=1 Tax=Pedobacter sp. MR2016-19 TaxID=2780089 RepID=UPI001873DF3D|nr:hypothetical protein [Pedobacter sp. MR2016-19]MBE5318008.1 hypothetical protein [Pedobacter sp. MR2016-19]